MAQSPARKHSLVRNEEHLAWLMLTPVVIALLVMGVYPTVTTLWLSFQQGGSFGQETTLGGLTGYLRLFRDAQFWAAFRFSILFTIITVAGQMIFGTALALFANLKFPGRWLVRAAILFPWAIPTSTNSVIWAYMFHDQYGLMNSLLIHLGLLNPAHPINWLGTTNTATILIYVIAIWKANSLVALLVLAGLQAIPEEIYEAAQVDGASSWQAVLRITLPLIKGTLAVTLILRTIESLQAFDIISAFTNGGPGNATQNLGLYITTQIQQYGDFPYGSNIATVLMLISFACIILYLRVLYRPGVR